MPAIVARLSGSAVAALRARGEDFSEHLLEGVRKAVGTQPHDGRRYKNVILEIASTHWWKERGELFEPLDTVALALEPRAVTIRSACAWEDEHARPSNAPSVLSERDVRSVAKRPRNRLRRVFAVERDPFRLEALDLRDEAINFVVAAQTAIATRSDLLREVGEADAEIEHAVISRREERLARDLRPIEIRPEEVAWAGVIMAEGC